MEVKFTYLAAKARAAMHAAGVPRERRLDFFPEVIMTMTKLDWLKLITINDIKKSRIEHYGRPLPRFTQYLCTWGEAGVIKTGKDRKTGDQGVTSMLMGYNSNHKGDCYRMWNLKTKKVSETREMVFLNRMFFKTPKMQVKKKQVTNDADLDSVQQDKRGLLRLQILFMVESVDSSVLNTQIVNSNPG